MHTARYAKKYKKDLLCMKYPQSFNGQFIVSGNEELLKDEYTTPIKNKIELERYIENLNLK